MRTATANGSFVAMPNPQFPQGLPGMAPQLVPLPRPPTSDELENIRRVEGINIRLQVARMAVDLFRGTQPVDGTLGGVILALEAYVVDGRADVAAPARLSPRQET
jgi:hypothetical protein